MVLRVCCATSGTDIAYQRSDSTGTIPHSRCPPIPLRPRYPISLRPRYTIPLRPRYPIPVLRSVVLRASHGTEMCSTERIPYYWSVWYWGWGWGY
eukprot:3936842-Rhodomonas_salina.1